jgi:GntR family transcriptional repressor for pyruvate dehydrogenase complex
MMTQIPYVVPPPFSLNRGGAADQIIVDIRDQILQGKLARGAKLPSERELAQTYQVSGPTIREAIRGLASLSLVESRHGTGVYVTASVDLMFAVATSTLIELEKVNMLEVLDTLEALYVKAAALACVHAPDEELAALALSLDTLDQEKSPDELSEGLRNFLGLMADAAHNVLISTFCKFLIGLLLESAKEQQGGLGGGWKKIAGKLGSDRRDLVHALQARDVTRATSLAAAYHRNTRRLVEELLQGGPGKGDGTISRASKRMRQARK